jgi:hypothetical protein
MKSHLVFKPTKGSILFDLARMQMMLALAAFFKLLCCRLKQDIAYRMHLFANFIDTSRDGFEQDESAFSDRNAKDRFSNMIRAVCLKLNVTLR